MENGKDVYKSNTEEFCKLCDETHSSIDKEYYRRVARKNAERIQSSFPQYCKKRECDKARESI